MEQDRQRLDKVLWFTRTVKSRALAVRLVEAGHVRINGQRATVPGRAVALGDVLTVALERDVRVLRIVGFAERRGPYSDARQLYEEWKDGALVPVTAVTTGEGG